MSSTVVLPPVAPVDRRKVIARVALFWLLYATLFTGIGVIMGIAPPRARLFVAGIVISAATLLITHGLARHERISPRDVGVAWSAGSIPRFFAGIAFGAGMMAMMFVVSRVVIGPAHFVRVPSNGFDTLPWMIATYIALSAGEELGFRGYPFRRLHSAFGPWVAQIVVALCFAVYHMMQGWDPISALIGTTAGSVLFGMATLATGGLAFPIGLHAAWNIGTWAMGTKSDAGLWRLDLATSAQPTAITGAAVYLTVMLLSTVALVVWMRRSRRSSEDGNRS